MRYGTCQKCFRYGNLEHHQCPPTFLCASADWYSKETLGILSREYWESVYAHDVKEAAEEFVAFKDNQCGEQIQGSRKVAVKDQNDKIHVFSVETYFEPVYTAMRWKEAKDDG